MQDMLYGWSSSEPPSSISYVWPAVRRLLPPGGPFRILDIGCGNGYIASEIAKLGHEVIGIDSSKDGISIARQAYPGLSFEIGSAYDEFHALYGHFNIIIGTELIEHLYYPRLFLERSFAALEPGGFIILSTPYHGYLKNLALSLLNAWDKHFAVHWDGGHIKFFSQNTLTQMLLATGFSRPIFKNAGRIPYLWKSMVCRAQKPY